MTKKNNVPAVVSVEDQMLVDSKENTGFENMGADDLAIPFLMILQSGSPQVRGATKIKDAREGDFFNTVTSEVLVSPIQIIPCAYEKAYIEWLLRENGGGYVQRHNDQSILDQAPRNDRNQNILPNGNQVVTTAYYYCILIKKGVPEKVVISLTSTQLKKARKWNSTMMSLKFEYQGRQITPPMFSHTYEAHTIEESNEKGVWSGWVFGNPEMIKDGPMYVAAKQFHDDCTSGNIRTAPPPGDEGDTVPNTGDEVF